SSKALIRFLRILLSKENFIQDLYQSIQNTDEVCIGNDPCPLCDPSGECLMPQSIRTQRCPLENDSV
ncbi:MAG: hypothetical protein ACP5I1_18040, partial [Candidatus Hinthialibacter sp.]